MEPTGPLVWRCAWWQRDVPPRLYPSHTPRAVETLRIDDFDSEHEAEAYAAGLRGRGDGVGALTVYPVPLLAA